MCGWVGGKVGNRYVCRYVEGWVGGSVGRLVVSRWVGGWLGAWEVGR
jgi:hypothetical protein